MQIHADPAKRGYHALYREQQVNYCPGCGRTHWHIGRVTAECGFCATAIPLEAAEREAPNVRIVHAGRAVPAQRPFMLDTPRLVRGSAS